jgi:hypothetical protein
VTSLPHPHTRPHTRPHPHPQLHPQLHPLPLPHAQVDLNEYIRWALRDALSRSSSRVIDLFRKWDVDDSGTVDKREFRKAIKSMGFDFFSQDSEIDMVRAPCPRALPRNHNQRHGEFTRR